MLREGNAAAGLALGTVQWGLPYGIANRRGQPRGAEVGRILHDARAAGVSILDTARGYGESEAVIGQLVGDSADWTVYTKLDPKADSAQAARASLHLSRQALRRDVLDGVLLHRAWQRTLRGGEIWDVLRGERDAGTIRQLGISAASPDEAWAALEDGEVTCIQVACNLLDQRLSRAGFFEAARRAGRIVFVRSVFLQGVAYLRLDELPAHLGPLRESLAAVHEWAGIRKVTAAQAFLAFASTLPEVRVLLGCEAAVQLNDNLRGWSQAPRLAGEIQALAAVIGEMPESIVNPAKWPRAA